MMVRGFITCIFLCLFAVTAWAEEKITDFDVTIDVAVNGDFTVTEKITVIAEGRTIKRGIFRELPRYLKTEDGYKIPQRYKFLSVKRNGENAPYHRETNGNAKLLRIGDADVFLKHGTHVYEITYHLPDQIRREEDFDEVYWNVTGNYWRYPIDAARASINMPGGVQLQSQNVWTGRIGSKESAATFSQENDAFVFEASREFQPQEGMTISLSFDKGVLAGQSQSSKRFLWWIRNGAMTILSLSFLFIAGFYYRAWNKVGRDPVKGPVFARYAPPENYSAAAVSHVHYKGVRGHKALSATLVGLAIKKRLHIDTGKKETVLTRLDLSYFEDAPALNREERVLLNTLFPASKSDTITLRKKYHARFTKAYTSFKKHLGRNYAGDYHKFNMGYIILGIVLSVAAIALTLSQIYGPSPKILWGLLAGLVIFNFLFMFLMPAPTKKGQEIGTEIDGFKLFLETAEKQKFNAAKVGSDMPPPMSIDYYEAMLPYAMAMGVEKPWAKYLEKVMPEEAKAYSPSWTTGSYDDFGSLSKMTDSLSSNLSSGVSSAQPQSSSSSSSGGGGFSGGGGGGGGGGGW